MAELGYFLSSEEHGPGELVAQAQMAEEAGFRSVFISDHFHPWIDRQGESPFVWSVIGAIAAIHRTAGDDRGDLSRRSASTRPIIAQAAATSQLLSDGRFVFGVGSGETLNEHILGDQWPPADDPARDARRGGRGDPRAVGGQDGQPPRPPLHGGERPALLGAPTSRRRSPSRRFGDRSADAGGPDRRRLGDRQPRRRHGRALPARAGGGRCSGAVRCAGTPTRVGPASWPIELWPTEALARPTQPGAAHAEASSRRRRPW